MSCIIMSCMAVDEFHRNFTLPPPKKEKKYGIWYGGVVGFPKKEVDQIILESD